MKREPKRVVVVPYCPTCNGAGAERVDLFADKDCAVCEGTGLVVGMGDFSGSEQTFPGESKP